jgi:hypothetical protein
MDWEGLYRELDERVRAAREQRALLDADVAGLLDRRREAGREARLTERFEARVARLEERIRALELVVRTYP